MYAGMTLNNSDKTKDAKRISFSAPSVEIIRFEDRVVLDASDPPGENEGWSDDIR